jgi:hypothetical protein
MKAFVPCEVENQFKTYKTRIIEHVYDPLRVEEVNQKFKDAGYDVDDDDVHVIAINEDGSILLWGGLNSVFHLRKGERIAHCLDTKHIAFNDILDLTNRFKIKNKKVEIDELIAKLKMKYQ